jgi:GT2 family glycosyltransferase
MTGITAIVTAFDRTAATLETLRRILACDPAPSQVLVHVDGGRSDCADAVRAAPAGAVVMVSDSRVGPGGARNRLMAAASCELVASFDDDSYPIDRDYFARAAEMFRRFPQAAIVTARVIHAHEPVAEPATTAEWTADFSGGACVYRRAEFLDAGGYVPLAAAYGMEEVDLALRLHARGRRILRTDWLRVFHDTDLARHADPSVTAASLANIVLLAYLRYPVALWGVGLLQLANRLQWLLRHGRRRGVMRGLGSAVPSALAHQSYRDPLPASAIRSYLSLRRHPVAIGWTR